MIVNRWIHYIVFLLSPALVLGVGTIVLLPFMNLNIPDEVRVILNAISGLMINILFIKLYVQKKVGNIRSGFNAKNIIYAGLFYLIIVSLLMINIMTLLFLAVGFIPALLTAVASDLLTLYCKHNKVLWIGLTSILGFTISIIFYFMDGLGLDLTMGAIGLICALFSSMSLVIYGNFHNQ